MKYVLIGALAILLIGGIVLYILRPAPAAPATGGTTSLPTASSTEQGSGLPLGGTTTGSSTSETLMLATTGTTTVTVQDFLRNGTTIEDPQNPGQYYLAGSLGYCLPDGTCPGGAPTNEYHIIYSAADQDFIISLKEPLGPARTDAENYLQSVLGASRPVMCELKYYVGTDVYTNSQFAGKNLGFSFCPGATQLPSN